MNVLLDALATFRLQRLLGIDGITDGVRARLARWTRRRFGDDAEEWIEELLDCPWCRSVWAAMVIVACRRVPGGRLVRDVLALSAVASLIVTHWDKEAIHDPDGVEH